MALVELKNIKKSFLLGGEEVEILHGVNLSVEEVVEYSPEAKISYGERLWLSLKNGLKSVGDFFSDFLVWFVGALPALVILAVLIVVLLPLLRKWSRRSREKRAARKAAKAEKSGES